MRVLSIALAVVIAGAAATSAPDGTTTGGQTDESGWGVWAHTPGDAGTPSGSGDAVASGESGTTSPPPVQWKGGADPHRNVCDSADGCPGSDPAATPPPPAAPGTPTISDVARFLVGNPTVTSEPKGWTIAGAQTNFIASAGEREQAGELLGQPVTVHFTPVAYAWRYGDGRGQTVGTPGRSWAASDLPNFSKTATSHAYANRGTYTVTVTVAFAARYQFAGQGWVDIAGTLGLTSDPITVTVKGVKTVLVGKTCDENPSGPGC